MIERPGPSKHFSTWKDCCRCQQRLQILRTFDNYLSGKVPQNGTEHIKNVNKNVLTENDQN